MKNFFALVFIFACSSYIFSQKVYIESFDIKVKKLLPPQYLLDSNLISYKISLEDFVQDFSDRFMTRNEVLPFFQIRNLILDSISPPINIIAGFSPVTGSTLKKVNIKPEYPGKPMRCGLEIIISGRLDLKIKVNEKELKKYTFNYNETHSSPSFTTWEEVSAFTNNKEKIESYYINARKYGLRDLLNQANQKINYDYGYTPVEQKQIFFSLIEEEHPEYKEFEEAMDNLIFSSLKMEYESLDSFKLYTNGLITFWKNKYSSYSNEDSEQKKLKFACCYNLSRIHFVREEFAEAKIFAKEIEIGSYKSSEGKYLLEEISEAEAALQARKMNSNYFELRRSNHEKNLIQQKKIETLEMMKKGELVSLPEFNSLMNVQDNSKIQKTNMVLKDGKELNGFIVYEAPFDLRNLSKIRLAFVQNCLLLKKNLSEMKFDRFILEDKSYYFLNHNDPKVSSIDIEINKKLLNDIKEFNKTKIVAFHSCCYNKYELKNNVDLSNVYVTVFNKVTNKYTELDGLKSYTKYLKEAILGCPEAENYVNSLIEEASKLSLKEKLKEKINLEKVIKTLEIYDNCN